MEIKQTSLPEVFTLTPQRHGDARGFFEESWSAKAWAQAGLAELDWVQDNHSLSDKTGTLRGLHYQAPPHGQAKLVRCIVGSIFDVVVDARRGSPNFGKWVGVELSSENGRQIFVPEGFLHGFVTRAPSCEIVYKCTDHYTPDADGSVHWNSCGIDWGLNGEPVLSAKDETAPEFAKFDSPFRWDSVP